MKNKIWRNWKTAGAALVMTCSLLAGSGSVVLGADGNMPEAAVLQDAEKQSDMAEEMSETEEETGIDPESDLGAGDVDWEDMEEMDSFQNFEKGQELDLAETADQTETLENREASAVTNGAPETTESSAQTETSLFTDSEDKEQTPSYKLWITPQQKQIKAGKELLYTISVENNGNCRLQNISLQTAFSDTSLKGAWEETEDAVIQDEKIELNSLEIGLKKEVYFSVQIPEEKSGMMTLYLTGSAEYEDKETGVTRNFVFTEESSETEVLPLKADFQVTKTADRTMAVPGDKIIFQICIRNTGERTLHSVVTTEKFQLQNVEVKFLEAEGIILNKDRTKAKIEKIEPGYSVGLLAEVTLPEKLEDQKLVNEVIVTTAETGERKVTSKAEIQVYKEAETAVPAPTDVSDGSKVMQETDAQGKAASTHPKTGDSMKPALWLLVIPGSLIVAAWACCRMRN